LSLDLGNGIKGLDIFRGRDGCKNARPILGAWKSHECH